MLPRSWPSWLTTLIAAPIAYAALLVVLRIGGKRTLAKMTAYGLTVTVAFGSLFATVILSRSVPVVDGAVAFATLAGLQWILATWSSRSTVVARLVTARPTLVVCRGAFDEERLRNQRIRLDDVRAAVRAAGHSSLDEVLAVVLETDGSLSVVARSDAEGLEHADALEGVEGWNNDPS